MTPEFTRPHLVPVEPGAATTPEWTDCDLARECLNNNPRAQDLFVGRYKRVVYARALALCRHIDDAEDLTQETFEAAIRGLPRYRGEASLEVWILRILHHLYVNQQRIKKVRRLFVSQWNEGDKDASIEQAPAFPPLPAPTPEAMARDVDKRLRRRIVFKCLRALPLRFRQVVVLRYLLNLSHFEIAQELNLSLGTVRSRNGRGLALMRRRLSQLSME